MHAEPSHETPSHETHDYVLVMPDPKCRQCDGSGETHDPGYLAAFPDDPYGALCICPCCVKWKERHAEPT